MCSPFQGRPIGVVHGLGVSVLSITYEYHSRQKIQSRGLRLVHVITATYNTVNLNTQNNFFHEDTNLRFHSFTTIWFDYEKKKEDERKQSDSKRKYHNKDTRTRFAGSQDTVKRNQPYKHESSKAGTVALQNRKRAHGPYHNTT